MSLSLEIVGYGIVERTERDELSSGVTYQRVDEDGDRAVSYSSGFTIYGDAAAFVYNALELGPPEAELRINVYDDCCGERRRIFAGRVRRENVSYCLEGRRLCELTFDATDAGQAPELERCLRGKLVNKDTPNFLGSGQSFWNYASHPKIPYCNDLRPGVLRHFVIVGGLLVGIILAVLVPVIAVLSLVAIIISAIITAIAAIASIVGGNGVDGDTNKIDDTMGVINEIFNLVGTIFRDSLPKFMTGCGYEHVAPLARHYVLNACQQCGEEIYGDPFAVTFTSSILNESTSLYYDLSLLYCDNEEGFSPEDGTQIDNITPSTLRDFWTRNSPNRTGGQILDDLATLFNAEWRAEDGLLTFEPRDRSGEEWIDLRTAEAQALLSEGPCYQNGQEPPPRYGDYKYQQDAADTVGNEALHFWNDIVPFDRPSPLPGAAGAVEKFFGFTTFRARQDGLRPDPLKFWEGFIEGANEVIGGDFDAEDHALLLQIGKSITPKIVLLERNFDPDNALPERRNIGGGVWAYNVPMWVAAGYYDAQYAEDADSKKLELGPNLWEYHEDDDPRTGAQAQGATEVTFTLKKDCDLLTAIYAQIEARGGIFLYATVDRLRGPERAYINQIIVNEDEIQVTAEI